jgi:diphthamide biosynthesis protein 2
LITGKILSLGAFAFTSHAFALYYLITYYFAHCLAELSHKFAVNVTCLTSLVQVLYGLEYSYSIKNVREALVDALRLPESKSELGVHLADVMSSVTNPSDDNKSSNGLGGPAGDCTEDKTFGMAPGSSYSIGGLIWTLPDGHRMEDYLLFWIGSDNSAFANVVLTFNGCDIGRQIAMPLACLCL